MTPSLNEPVYLRWEHTTHPHRKFYELEVELSLFYPKTLVRRWGRIGTRRPRRIRMLIGDREELQRQAALIRRQRILHGYHLVKKLQVPAIEVVAA